jgi:hypothetical protein
MLNYTVAIHVNDWLILIQDTVVSAKAGCSAVCWNQSVCNGQVETRSNRNLWLVIITAKKMVVFWGCTIKLCQTLDSFWHTRKQNQTNAKDCSQQYYKLWNVHLPSFWHSFPFVCYVNHTIYRSLGTECISFFSIYYLFFLQIFKKLSLRTTLPYILESNPHPFCSFKGLKNQMQIIIACGLDLRSRDGFWKNDKSRCTCRKNNIIQYNNLLFYLLL